MPNILVLKTDYNDPGFRDSNNFRHPIPRMTTADDSQVFYVAHLPYKEEEFDISTINTCAQAVTTSIKFLSALEEGRAAYEQKEGESLDRAFYDTKRNELNSAYVLCLKVSSELHRSLSSRLEPTTTLLNNEYIGGESIKVQQLELLKNEYEIVGAMSCPTAEYNGHLFNCAIYLNVDATVDDQLKFLNIIQSYTPNTSGIAEDRLEKYELLMQAKLGYPLYLFHSSGEVEVSRTWPHQQHLKGKNPTITDELIPRYEEEHITTAKVIKRLDKYIADIASHKLGGLYSKQIDFAYGYKWPFKDSKTSKRKANYNLAVSLRKSVKEDFDPPLCKLFSEDNIERLRSQSFSKIGECGLKFQVIDEGLKAIIALAQPGKPAPTPRSASKSGSPFESSRSSALSILRALEEHHPAPIPGGAGMTSSLFDELKELEEIQILRRLDSEEYPDPDANDSDDYSGPQI